MQAYIKSIKQNNDHTRIVPNIRFCSSFKDSNRFKKENSNEKLTYPVA